MIPKITQDAPNIVPRYWCSTCGRSLPAPDQHDDQWRFCPRCGEPIEYEKAEPVQFDPTGAGPQAFLPGEL